MSVIPELKPQDGIDGTLTESDRVALPVEEERERSDESSLAPARLINNVHHQQIHNNHYWNRVELFTYFEEIA